MYRDIDVSGEPFYYGRNEKLVTREDAIIEARHRYQFIIGLYGPEIVQRTFKQALHDNGYNTISLKLTRRVKIE
jgi:hypothetical protein